MNNCSTCGKPVRLGANKITVNRKRGVFHYVAHMDGSPMHESGWDSICLKPYPKIEADKPYAQLIERWNTHNAAVVRQERSDCPN